MLKKPLGVIPPPPPPSDRKGEDELYLLFERAWPKILKCTGMKLLTNLLYLQLAKKHRLFLTEGLST